MAFHDRPRRWLPFVLVGVAVLTAAVSAGIGCGGDKPPPPAATSTGVASTDGNIDQQTLASLEKSAKQIEEAFRSGDVETVISLTHPAERSSYRTIFREHGADLKRVADLLATRKLVGVTDGMAEYEVTENGETFYVTFESWGEQWYLSSL